MVGVPPSAEGDCIVTQLHLVKFKAAPPGYVGEIEWVLVPIRE
jgi:hypothetical protein